MKSLLVSMYLAGLLDPETVTCNLWKRLEINEVKHCIYRGPNRTVYTHFPTHRWSECPKQFQCPYSSMKDKKPTVHEMLKGIREVFGN
jgi:hypothetical protein